MSTIDNASAMLSTQNYINGQQRSVRSIKLAHEAEQQTVNMVAEAAQNGKAQAAQQNSGAVKGSKIDILV